MALICPKCNTLNDKTAGFCMNCGSAVAANSSGASASFTAEKTAALDHIKDYSERTVAAVLIPMFLSMFITFVFQKYIVAYFGHANFLYRLLIPTGEWLQLLVPTLTFYIFVWSCIDLLWKALRNIRISRCLGNAVVSQLPISVRSKSIDAILQELAQVPDAIRHNIVFMRILSLLQHIQSTRDLQRSHEFFKHQTSIDSDTAQSGYTLIKIFIWAMPILGFLGTVIGISDAVGNFSGFLSGDIEKVDIIKRELAKITTGLSYAFDTTLLGLAGSLGAMLFSTFVQTREETSLTDLEELGLRIVANASTGTADTKADELAANRAELSDQIAGFSQAINHLTVQLHANAERLRDAPALIENFCRSFSKEAGLLTDCLGTSTSRLHDITKSLSDKESEDSIMQSLSRFKMMMHDQTQTVSENIRSFIKSMQESAIALSGEFSRLPDEIKSYRAGLKEESEHLSRSMTLAATHFETLTEKTQQFHESTQLLVNEFSQLFPIVHENEQVIKNKIHEFEELSSQFKAAFTANTERFVTSLGRFSGKVEDLNATQKTTAQAVQALDELNLLISAMQKSQEDITRFLSELTGPLEFRLFPAAKASSEKPSKK